MLFYCTFVVSFSYTAQGCKIIGDDVFNNYRTTLMILEYSGFQVKPPPRTVFAVIIYSFPVGFVDRIDELKGLPEFKEPPKPFEIE